MTALVGVPHARSGGQDLDSAAEAVKMLEMSSAIFGEEHPTEIGRVSGFHRACNDEGELRIDRVAGGLDHVLFGHRPCPCGGGVGSIRTHRLPSRR